MLIDQLPEIIEECEAKALEHSSLGPKANQALFHAYSTMLNGAKLLQSVAGPPPAAEPEPEPEPEEELTELVSDEPEEDEGDAA